ncbi:MAG: AmmeMemoRadiSam system radical SAM enzyme [Candidatus Hydrothermales bacterium]
MLEIGRLTKEGELYQVLDGKKVRCLACAHKCVIFEGKRGICKVRFNVNGKLYVPFNYVSGLNNDPIEKKPFFHFLPGSYALTFGMLGCNFHCPYCQNWLTSQALKDKNSILYYQEIEPSDIVKIAIRKGSKSIISSYNEPLITTEWAKEIFKLAKEKGLKTGYVSNGYLTDEVLDYLDGYLDSYKIDLKSFRDENYRILGGKLKFVLEGIEKVYKRGLWLEIVTLLVPNYNSSEDELREIARFIKSISPYIPWHITAFHPDYKMTDRRRTEVRKIIRAREIGLEEGLKFVYGGNVYGFPELESTYCPECGELLIKREIFFVIENKIKDGRCIKCKAEIKGVWE